MKKIILLLLVVGICISAWFFISPLFLNTETNESLPEDFIPTKDESIVDGVSSSSVVRTEVAEESQTVIVKSGLFTDADSFHKGEGEAKIIKNNSNAILRFENFKVTNGPDLYVLLAQNANPTDRESFGTYVELEKLKGNIGSQNYDLTGIDLETYNSIIIYCKAFGVIFSTATLQ